MRCTSHACNTTAPSPTDNILQHQHASLGPCSHEPSQLMCMRSRRNKSSLGRAPRVSKRRPKWNRSSRPASLEHWDSVLRGHERASPRAAPAPCCVPWALRGAAHGPRAPRCGQRRAAQATPRQDQPLSAPASLHPSTRISAALLTSVSPKLQQRCFKTHPSLWIPSLGPIGQLPLCLLRAHSSPSTRLLLSILKAKSCPEPPDPEAFTFQHSHHL